MERGESSWRGPDPEHSLGKVSCWFTGALPEAQRGADSGTEPVMIAEPISEGGESRMTAQTKHAPTARRSHPSLCRYFGSGGGYGFGMPLGGTSNLAKVSR